MKLVKVKHMDKVTGFGESIEYGFGYFGFYIVVFLSITLIVFTITGLKL